MNKDILDFQRKCYNNYLTDLKELGLVPENYLFPFGNMVRPVIPTKTHIKGIMLIGAFPSARFEVIQNLLVPCANNLSPFGEEEYYDGKRVRVQESRDSLNKNYFSILNIDPNKLWLTDIVKIYLFPEKHIKNCLKINPNISYVNTHKEFKKLALASMKWILEEITLCTPKLIITLGEITARVLTGDSKSKNIDLLSGSVTAKDFTGQSYNVAHLAHPEIYRINNGWKKNTDVALKRLSQYINENNLNE